MVQIMQLNLGRARAAHDMALEEAMRRKADIMFISEPNRKICTGAGWHMERGGDVALRVCNSNLEITRMVLRKSYVHLMVGDIHFFAVYISPNIAYQPFRNVLDEVFCEASKYPKNSIVLGDINSKSPMWGSPFSDVRGEAVEEWLAQLSWGVANDGGHTFERGLSRSHIDVTFASADILRRIATWEVQFSNPFTHHGHIFFELQILRTKNRAPRVKHILLAAKLRGLLAGDIWGSSGGIYRDFLGATKSATRATTVAAADQPYWWSEEIETCRENYKKLRRKLSRRNARGNGSEELETRMVTARKLLKRLIRISKRKSWRDVLEKLDEDIWGEGYKIVTSHFHSGSLGYQIPTKIRRKILSDLFPFVENDKIPRRPTIHEEVHGFTERELAQAIKAMKNGKAPGPDGVTVEAVKIFHQACPEKMLEMFNKMLVRGKFPTEWKTARVVLLPKKGRDLNLSSGYRPICLINTIGKLYERLLLNRLQEELDEKDLISENQHGFRRGKSTTSAMLSLKQTITSSNSRWCILMTVDIKNAFNTIDGSCIVEAMIGSSISDHLVRCVVAFLTDRRVKSGAILHKYNRGVPQGSVKGPTLWNVGYDGVLKLPYGNKVRALAYADDLLFVIEGGDDIEVISRAERTLKMMEEWIKPRGLEIAAQKTELLIVRGPRNTETIKINFMGEEILPKTEMKYLGVVFQKKLQFAKHVKYTAEKAAEKQAAFMRLMPNIGGPGYNKRRLLCGVVHSTLLYAAPVWREVLKIKEHKDTMTSVQRVALLRVISGYRTVSALAAQVVAGFPPIDLMVAERCFLYTIGGALPGNRRMASRRTLRMWQQRWENSEQSASWTKRLIRKIEPWIECTHRTTGYFFTQFLTGHGSYGSFTKRIGKTEDDMCHVCQVKDDPEHMFFYCKRWEEERKALKVSIGRLPPTEEIIKTMIADKITWNLIFQYITVVMRRKESEDRERQV